MRTLVFFVISLVTVINSSFLNATCSFEADPHALIARHVDGISGAWLEEEADLVVSSRVPFTLKRYYSSEWGRWQFFSYCLLVRAATATDSSIIATFEKNATPLKFISQKKNALFELALPENAPVCNTAHGSLSFANNYDNFSCQAEDHQVIIRHPDGTKRIYEQIESADLGPLCTPHLAPCQGENVHSLSYFRLVAEIFPTQASVLYRYDAQGRLQSLELVHNPHASKRVISFSYDRDAIYVFVDGQQKVSYGFNAGKLVQVQRVQKPTVNYTYDTTNLIRKDYPQGRFQKIQYDSNNKVAAIFGPLSKEPLYHFEYLANTTKVCSAEGHERLLLHQGGLLQEVALYVSQKLYRRDCFVWDKTRQVQKLISQTTKNSNDTALWAINHEYDEVGNLLQSKTFATATEQPELLLSIDSQGRVLGESESETPRFVYKGPFGAISEQNDGKGNKVEYTYKEGTQLVTERLEKVNKEYVDRAFYTYDKTTGALIKEIHDTGKERKESDLYGTQRRWICEIEPRLFPPAGLDVEVRTQKVYFNSYDSRIPRQEYLVRKERHFYDTDNNLVKKELYDATGGFAKCEEYQYDAHGNCIKFIDALGQVVSQTYDENDNCTQIEEAATGRVIAITYDLANNPTCQKVTYLNGSVVTTSKAYDLFGNVIASTDRYGNSTEYAYDAFSRLISCTYPQVLNEEGVVIRPEQYFAYDIFNNIIEKTDPKAYKEQYRYSSSGKVLRIDYPDGTHEEFVYNGHKIEAITNRDASVTRYRYDQERRLEAIETFLLHKEQEGEEKQRDVCLRQQKFVYPRFSHSTRFEKAQKPNGSWIEQEFDLFDRLAVETDSDPSIPHQFSFQTEIEYDALHRPSRKKRWIDTKTFIVECCAYDALDRVIERWVVEPDNTHTSHEYMCYDSFGNVCEREKQQITYLEGNRVHLITQADGSVQRIDYIDQHYNTLGQRHLVKIVTDPSGKSTTVSYDALGREVEVILKDPFGNISRKRLLAYDACNNLAVCLESNNVNTTIRTEWTYGPMQRLEMLKEAVCTDICRQTHYRYNAVGKLALVTLSDGTSNTYEYGVDGTLSKLLNAKGEVISTLFINQNGQLVGGTSQDNVRLRRTYRADGRISEEVIEDKWGAYKCHYHYDRLGRIQSILLPGNEKITYQYEGSRQKAVKYVDWDAVYSHEVSSYNDRGQPIEEKLITGDIQSRSYSLAGALTSITSQYLTESIERRDERGFPLEIARKEGTTEYGYNSLNQLISEKTPSNQERYSYDFLGNLTQHNDKQFTANALNQLASSQTALQYDKKGNLIATGSLALSYNENNQLIQSQELHSTMAQKYGWDAAGRRAFQVTGNTVRRYVYMGTTEIGAVDQHGSLVELKIPERIVGNTPIGAVGIKLKYKWYLPVHDLWGNIVQLVDAKTKAVVESYTYTAYGQETIYKDGQMLAHSAVGNPWRYRGIRTDSATKLVQFAFRDYLPELQRFLTQDPTGFADGPNVYGFAHANPIIYTDLDGLATKVGPCLCHGTDCEYYVNGRCGHGAGVSYEESSPPPIHNVKIKQFFTWEQGLAGDRLLVDEDTPVNYSKRFELGEKSISNKGIGFINGVKNSIDDAKRSGNYLCGMAQGAKIQVTYAATNGVIDFAHARLNLNDYYATNPTKLLYDTWTEYFENAGDDATYLQVCHSWGAIHTRNALMMLKPDTRQKINVVAVAPGGYIDSSFCKDVIHIINKDAWKDPVTRIDMAGLKMARAQGTVREVLSDENETALIDHSFQSKTYQKNLNIAIIDFFIR